MQCYGLFNLLSMVHGRPIASSTVENPDRPHVRSQRSSE